MRLPRLLRTPSFRLSLISAALFGAAAVLVFGVMYWEATGFMARQIDGSIGTQMTALAEDERTGGPAHLADVVTRRQSAPGTQEFVYLVLDAGGTRLAGNLPISPPRAGWQTVALPDQGGDDPDDHALRALGKRLEDGTFVVVARDTHELDEVADFMEHTFAAGFAVTLAVAIGAGLLVSAEFLRRLDSITRTSVEIMAGDLSRRIPLSGGTGDFDRLAGNLNGMLDRIEALMDGMRQVTTDIAHDMRTPLTRLRHRLEQARTGARTAGEFKAALDRALGETDTILETFAALLRIAQISSGMPRTGLSPVDLGAIAATIAETYGPVAEDEKHTLTATITDGVVVPGDSHLLTQMLANLVENALKHTPSGSAITLAVRANEPGRGPVLVVADNGPGIPEDERSKVFRRFYRLGASRTTPGNGLGLSLVAAIAERHGASVLLEDNEPGLRATVAWPG